MELVDDWYVYDNSQSYYELIAKRVNSEQIILNFEKYNQLTNYGSD